ncbi:MAG: acyltransferase family protein [Janthinobacterium lividum]
MITKPHLQRIFFLDYLRAFLVCLVVLDHAMHAYALHFGFAWFLPDFDRTTFFDVLHMHNDSFMMPALFFLAGLFVIPSLQRRGYLNFVKERAVRLGIPFILGVVFITPLLTYPKYLTFQNPNIDYWTYVTTIFVNTPQAGPFWFLYYLLLLSGIALIIYAVFPKFYHLLGILCQKFIDRPLMGVAVVMLIGACLIGASDIKWGPHGWIGYGKLFYVRGSRFLFKGFLFFLGIGFSGCHLLQNQTAWQRLDVHWKQWTLLAIFIGTVYITYALSFFDEGAYNSDVARHLRTGGLWEEAWPILQQTAPAILIRTTLLAMFIVAQIMAYLAIFHHFLNHESESWQSLAVSSYGIYLIHEPFVVWSHWFFYGTDVPTFMKFVLSGFGSLFISWAIVRHGLFKFPMARRIL